jgi:hypothetical protein
VFKEHKMDIVLSTLGHERVRMQKPLADTAKLAVVKLFVPSEFGSTTHGHTVEAFKAKNEVAGKIINKVSLIPGEPH